MGGGHWDSKLYSASTVSRAVKGTKDFAHSATVMAAAPSARKAHKDLDPAKIKDSLNKMRESRDSEEHPDSRAIAVIFDVTGSMREVPQVFQKNLNKLMSLLMLKGKVEHPQILIGAVGDATCDRIPFQLSQFESGNLIDEHLRKIVLEGGGGGQMTESYELALYAMARLTSIDCWEKRQQKGYLFLSGDELPYPAVKKDEVNSVFGIGEQANIAIEDILKELQEKWEVFFIIPDETQHANESVVHDTWAKLLGQRVLHLDNPAAICELIASSIATEEGYDIAEILESLKEAGTTPAVVTSVTKTLAAVR